MIVNALREERDQAVERGPTHFIDRIVFREDAVQETLSNETLKWGMA